MSAIDLAHPIDPQADDEAHRFRVQLAIRRADLAAGPATKQMRKTLDTAD